MMRRSPLISAISCFPPQHLANPNGGFKPRPPATGPRPLPIRYGPFPSEDVPLQQLLAAQAATFGVWRFCTGAAEGPWVRNAVEWVNGMPMSSLRSAVAYWIFHAVFAPQLHDWIDSGLAREIPTAAVQTASALLRVAGEANSVLTFHFYVLVFCA